MSTVLLNLTGISYTYFTHPILRDLNWEIQAGQKIGLIGANGGGKSTLLKLILGQLAPEAGSIFRIKDLTIGYLPQDMTPSPPTPSPMLGEGSNSGKQGLPLPRRDGGEGWGEGAVTVLDAALSGSPEIARLRGALAEGRGADG